MALDYPMRPPPTRPHDKETFFGGERSFGPPVVARKQLKTLLTLWAKMTPFPKLKAPNGRGAVTSRGESLCSLYC